MKRLVRLDSSFKQVEFDSSLVTDNRVSVCAKSYHELLNSTRVMSRTYRVSSLKQWSIGARTCTCPVLDTLSLTRVYSKTVEFNSSIATNNRVRVMNISSSNEVLSRTFRVWLESSHKESTLPRV